MNSYTIACTILKKLYKKGFIAYFTGGWVRDFLMDRSSDDIDIATNASVEDIKEIFPKTIAVGINFGVVIVVEKECRFEVATFRKDCEYKDGRHPTGVEYATPEEDAKRRDFTINGMFYDPLNKQLYDFVGGQRDIEKGIIRAIGDPYKRFAEDRLRMIRAVRYACRFHFSLEKGTLAAILYHAHTLFPSVAIERIWNEFSKMASFSNFDIALVTLHRFNLLAEIFPVLKEVSVEEVQKRVQSIRSFPEESPVIAKILELFPHSTLDEKEKLCLYLKLSKSEKSFVYFYHRAVSILMCKTGQELCEWAHFYAHPLYPICLKIIVTHLSKKERSPFLREHHMRNNQLKSAIQKIQSKTPFLSSHDLRKIGIPNGKKMGRLLKEGERLAINKSINQPEEIIKHLQNSSVWEED